MTAVKSVSRYPALSVHWRYDSRVCVMLWKGWSKIYENGCEKVWRPGCWQENAVMVLSCLSLRRVRGMLSWTDSFSLKSDRGAERAVGERLLVALMLWWTEVSVAADMFDMNSFFFIFALPDFEFPPGVEKEVAEGEARQQGYEISSRKKCFSKGSKSVTLLSWEWMVGWNRPTINDQKGTQTTELKLSLFRVPSCRTCLSLTGMFPFCHLCAFIDRRGPWCSIINHYIDCITVRASWFFCSFAHLKSLQIKGNVLKRFWKCAFGAWSILETKRISASAWILSIVRVLCRGTNMI